jgi:hypothetical protein
MFPGPESAKLVVVQCKGCHESIPAPVEGMPAQPTSARCPRDSKESPTSSSQFPARTAVTRLSQGKLMRLSSHIIKCPKCGGVFDEMAGREPISTS